MKRPYERVVTPPMAVRTASCFLGLIASPHLMLAALDKIVPEAPMMRILAAAAGVIG